MGVAGWRFAPVKRNAGGRATFVAFLEEWPGICSVVVAASSMIMIGIYALQRLAGVSPARGRPTLRGSTERTHAAESTVRAAQCGNRPLR